MSFSSSLKFATVGFFTLNLALPALAQNKAAIEMNRICSGEILDQNELDAAVNECTGKELNNSQVQLQLLKGQLAEVKKQLDENSNELSKKDPAYLLLKVPFCAVGVMGVIFGFSAIGGGINYIAYADFLAKKGVPQRLQFRTISIAGLITMVVSAAVAIQTFPQEDTVEIKILREDRSKLANELTKLKAEIAKREKIVAFIIQTKNLKD